MALNLDTLGLSATVTVSGISAPDYQTILSTITSYFQQIYGTDAYLDPDSKDGHNSDCDSKLCRTWCRCSCDWVNHSDKHAYPRLDGRN